MLAEEGVTAIEAMSTSRSCIPEGLVRVSVPVVVAAEVAARNVGGPISSDVPLADPAPRKVIWACAGNAASAIESRTRLARVLIALRSEEQTSELQSRFGI